MMYISCILFFITDFFKPFKALKRLLIQSTKRLFLCSTLPMAAWSAQCWLMQMIDVMETFSWFLMKTQKFFTVVLLLGATNSLFLAAIKKNDKSVSCQAVDSVWLVRWPSTTLKQGVVMLVTRLFTFVLTQTTRTITRNADQQQHRLETTLKLHFQPMNTDIQELHLLKVCFILIVWQ